MLDETWLGSNTKTKEVGSQRSQTTSNPSPQGRKNQEDECHCSCGGQETPNGSIASILQHASKEER